MNDPHSRSAEAMVWHILPQLLPSPISLSLSSEEELCLGALCVVQQEQTEEVLVRSMQLHFTLFPSNGGEWSMVKYQEPAASARQKEVF